MKERKTPQTLDLAAYSDTTTSIWHRISMFDWILDIVSLQWVSMSD